MAEFPLMPNLSKILLTAASMQCSEEVLSIVSMLSVNHIFVRPKAKKKEHLSLLLIELIKYCTLPEWNMPIG